MIKKNSKIYITGHKGLVGSSVLNLLKKNGYKNVVVTEKKKLNLLDKNKVEQFIKKKKIKFIINCVKVGNLQIL